jgi:thiosulfate/3-mercaptopyruvate sulfurtransferase
MTGVSPLISTERLARRASDPNVVVVDASVFLVQINGHLQGEWRSGLDRFTSAGHIPGARFADMFVEFSDATVALPFMRPKRKNFELAAGRLGISPTSHVVIYDALANQWASRLWWVFRSFGHDKVSVLDGGLRKYRKEGRPLSQQLGAVQPVTYEVSRERTMVASRGDVLAVHNGEKKAHLVCFLQPDEYAGKISVRARPGHIPNSVNLPFVRLLNDDNTLLSAPALRAQFSHLLDLDGRPVITYCGAGVGSTVGTLALALIRYRNTLEYDGSLSEWADDASLPLACSN